MTNTEMLKQKIALSGYKLEFIAKQIGITRQALSKKINNRSEFDQGEILKLCDVLKITSLREKEELFFCR